MTLISLIGALELGLAYSLVALGLYISFRILNIPDLTVDGSFVLGASVSAVLAFGGHPVLGVAAAVAAGAAAGMVTALLQTRMGIDPVLAGILTMTGLYSVNLGVMGNKSNIPLLNKASIFSLTSFLGNTWGRTLLLALIVGVIFLIYNLFFKTNLGLSIRAAGDNPVMVRASSINTNLTKTVALAIANATVALSGACVSQLQSSTDVNMGAGMVVIGLASLIIGELLIPGKSVFAGSLAVILGAILYRVLIAFVLRTSLPPSYLKLVSSLIVAAALAIPTLRRRLEIDRLIRKNRRASQAQGGGEDA